MLTANNKQTILNEVNLAKIYSNNKGKAIPHVQSPREIVSNWYSPRRQAQSTVARIKHNLFKIVLVLNLVSPKLTHIILPFNHVCRPCFLRISELKSQSGINYSYLRWVCLYKTYFYAGDDFSFEKAKPYCVFQKYECESRTSKVLAITTRHGRHGDGLIKVTTTEEGIQ